MFFLTHKYIFSFGIILPLAILSFGAVISNKGTPLWYFGMCAWFFYTGVLVHYLSAKIKSRSFWCFLCVILFLIFIILLMKYLDGKKVQFYNCNFFLFVPLLILAIQFDLCGLKKTAWVVKTCDYISSLTYSSFLLHFPIQVLVLIIFTYFEVNRGFFDSPFIFLLYICLMILISRSCYTHIERPLQKYFLKTLPDSLSLKRADP